MFEDDFLESDYEDRFTIQGDIDEEDKSYFEDEEDESDICPECLLPTHKYGCWPLTDESDIHPDSPSLQDTIGEWPSYGN